MAFPRIGGAGVGLNLTGAIGSLLPSASNVFTGAAPTNIITLSAGGTFIIPAGTFMLAAGPYTSVQYLDPVQGTWRNISADNGQQSTVIDSDGGNFRLANLTGCAVGALITNNGGQNATNGIGATATGVVVTPSIGGSVWSPIVGGAITTVTTTATGANYTFPPQLIVSQPPVGGIPATLTTTLSSGGIGTVTIVNPGAGYTAPPTIQIVNDIRDTTGAGAVLTPVISSSSGMMTGLLCTNHGLAQTTVPTLAFSVGSMTATMLMNHVLTGWTVSTANASLQSNTLGIVYNGIATLGSAGSGSGRATFTNIEADLNILQPRIGIISNFIQSNALVGSATGGTIIDAGFGFMQAPSIAIIPGGGAWPGTVLSCGSLAPTFGGISDTSYIQPI